MAEEPEAMEEFNNEGVPIEETIPEEIAEDPESNFFRNIAKDLEKEELDKIGEETVEGVENDKDTLTELESTRDEYNRLLTLHYEKKNTPWDNASNIKLPIIATACGNFWARIYGNMFTRPNKIVRSTPGNLRAETVDASDRQERYINYKYRTMPGFFTSFSKSMFMLPRDGYAFRKVYWDSEKGEVISTYVLPQDFIVNYYTKDLASSMRYAQVLRMSVNEIKIKGESGLYVNTDDLSEGSTNDPDLDSTTTSNKEDAGQTQPSDIDYTTPREVYEVHTYLFIGDQKIRKPYVVTVDKETRKVYRIIDRSSPITGKDMQYFVNYSFVENPDSIFGFGFGPMLLGITATMNTTVNQTIDAGTLSNVKGGWVLKGSQMARGSLSFKMGAFKQISVRSDDIRKAIFPLDFAPPSAVLLNLLTFLQDYVDRFTSVTDIFTGQAPKSDTTATAASLAAENGAQLFTTIQRLVFQKFGDEAEIMRDIYSIFLDKDEYLSITTDDVKEFAEMTNEQVDARIAADFSDDIDINLVGDPSNISQTQKLNKAEYLTQTIATNPFLAENPKALTLIMRRRLEAAELPEEDINALTLIMEESVQQQQQQQQAQAQAEQEGMAAQQGQEEVSNLETKQKDLQAEEREIRGQLEQKGGE